MVRRCPSNTICFEKVTLIFCILLIVGVSFYLVKNNDHKILYDDEKWIKNNIILGNHSAMASNINAITNPMPTRSVEPERREVKRGVRINEPTQSVPNMNYEQIGFLTKLREDETILPLYGKPYLVSRNKWKYYALSDKYNQIRLPISANGRSGTNDQGIDELNNGDTVYVQGYNAGFRVTLYERNQFEYIPYL